MRQRTVVVIDRNTWGTTAPYPLARAVTVDWICPRCGQPRGEPYSKTFYENDDYITCHRWDNLCGHIDAYADVLKEARFTRQDRRYIALDSDTPDRWQTFATFHPAYKALELTI